MNILDVSYGVVWCPGPDCISSCRNSSELNRTWKTELLPVLCETARVVPILKPRKLWWWLLKGHTWGNYLNCFEQFLSGSKIQILSDAAATFLVGAGSWWWTTATEEHKMMDQGSLYLRTFNRWVLSYSSTHLSSPPYLFLFLSRSLSPSGRSAVLLILFMTLVFATQ